jgi:hypothetical protein
MAAAVYLAAVFTKIADEPFYASMGLGILAEPTQGTFAIRFLISPASLGSPDLSAISKRYCRTDFIAFTVL